VMWCGVVLIYPPPVWSFIVGCLLLLYYSSTVQ
jgi:hypothetical protein